MVQARILPAFGRMPLDRIGPGGSVPLARTSPDAANWAFEIMCAMMFRAEEWGSVLGDEVMAAALIDRWVHHCHIFNIHGNSYRMRHHQDLLRPTAEDRRDGLGR